MPILQIVDVCRNCAKSGPLPENGDSATALDSKALATHPYAETAKTLAQPATVLVVSRPRGRTPVEHRFSQASPITFAALNTASRPRHTRAKGMSVAAALLRTAKSSVISWLGKLPLSRYDLRP